MALFKKHLPSEYANSSTLCDQIGLFLNVLEANLHTKVNQIFVNILAVQKSIFYETIVPIGNFLASFGKKLGYFLFTSGHTDSGQICLVTLTLAKFVRSHCLWPNLVFFQKMCFGSSSVFRKKTFYYFHRLPRSAPVTI